MTQDNQPIVVNLPEGQNTLTLMQGTAPKQLDELAPVKFEAAGTIEAPLRFLEQRVSDIDQHKAHIFVNRDNLSIHLVYNEDDAYTIGNVFGTLKLSKVFQSFGINTDKQWEPEQLGQFLKLNHTYFVSREENMKVVNALKTFDAKVNQTVQRETKENGRLSSVDGAILAALNIADKYFKAQQSSDNMRAQIRSYADECAQLRSEIIKLKKQNKEG